MQRTVHKLGKYLQRFTGQIHTYKGTALHSLTVSDCYLIRSLQLTYLFILNMDFKVIDSMYEISINI